jgi:hypothetical protein
MKLFELDLYEAQNYEQMFNSVFALTEYLPTDDAKQHVKNSIQEYIQWAKKTLKKNDRITWYLRIVKHHWLIKLNTLNYPHLEQSEVTILSQKIDKEINKLKKFDYFEKGNALSNTFRIQIEHYFSLPVEKIRNYVWSTQGANEIISDFAEYEEEWKESSGERAVDIQEGDDLILEFDGGTKGWWLLNRGACRDEGNAMGHCGNVPSVRSGDRILSFRVKNQNDQWTPNLTFILDGDGYLGEMKGRGNEKPAEKYHPYIIELLKQTKIIKGIKGGGYAPENNFSINDLDENQREELYKINPAYMTFMDMVNKFGEDDERVIKKAVAVMEDYIDYETFDEENKKFVIESWKDGYDLASDYGNDTAKYVAKVMNGDEYFEIYYKVDNSQISTFLNDLDIDERRDGKNYTTKQRIIDWLKEFDPEFDPDETDWVDYIISEDIDDIKSPVSTAILNGESAGAENEMYESFRKSFYDFESSLGVGKLEYETDENDIIKLYKPMKYTITIKDLVKLINDAGGNLDDLEDYMYEGFFEDSKLDVTEPYYGWQDYDESVARESFYDRLEEYI